MIQEENKRHIYSIFSLVVQYFIPFTIMSLVYSLLYCYLKRHRIVREDKHKQADRERARRTNIMLASISILYCLCWLPLNLFNLLSDVAEDIFKVGE